MLSVSSPAMNSPASARARNLSKSWRLSGPVAAPVSGVSCGRSHVLLRAHGHPRVYVETQRTRGGVAESSGLPGPGSGPESRGESQRRATLAARTGEPVVVGIAADVEDAIEGVDERLGVTAYCS